MTEFILKRICYRNALRWRLDAPGKQHNRNNMREGNDGTERWYGESESRFSSVLFDRTCLVWRGKKWHNHIYTRMWGWGKSAMCSPEIHA
jgi:hypothetical protein